MVDLHEISYDFVSLLTNNPEYIKRTVVTEDMIHEEFKLYFKCMVLMYSKFKRLDVVIFEKYNLRSLYESCVYNGIAIDIKSSFESYQEELINNYKKDEAKKIFQEWEKGVIEDNEYFREINNLQSLTPSKLKRLTATDIKRSITRKENRIKFNKFSILEFTLKLEEHDLLTLSGDTGVGKSALAINFLEDLSRNYPCIYFNMEMSESQINQRLLSIHSKEKLDNLVKYSKQTEEFQKEIDFRINNLMKDREIYIQSESQTINKISSTISSFNQEKHFIVFIDHAQLISVKGAKSAKERLDEVYKTLRKLSLDYNCTIIALCQLNRDSVKSNPRPKLTSLKDSSEIEQSSCKVCFVYCTVNEDETENYFFDIAKNRNGIKGNMKLVYTKPTQYMEIIKK